MQAFREIVISGNSHERGVMHGELLRGEISDAVDYYRSIFGLTQNKIFERAAHFLKVISEFNPEYAKEIEGIAKGSRQDLKWIIALNARTEILALGEKSSINECTSVCFAGPPIIGQTWDWGKSLEVLCVVMRIRHPDGFEICMLTEPGIIGKIGMNSAGLGVCLNILNLASPLEGVPIHIMLRAILDCKTTHQAWKTIECAPFGKSSNVIVADRSGDCFDLEFADDEILNIEPVNGKFVHTNHYLGKPINGDDDPLFDSSRARLDSGTMGISKANDETVEAMIDILSDRSNQQFPIFRPYQAHDILGEVGTVATLVMDLPASKIHIRKGNDQHSRFNTIEVF